MKKFQVVSGTYFRVNNVSSHYYVVLFKSIFLKIFPEGEGNQIVLK